MNLKISIRAITRRFSVCWRADTLRLVLPALLASANGLAFDVLTEQRWAVQDVVDEQRRVRIDEPPETRHELAPGLRYGSEVQVDVERTRDFDLDSREDDDVLAWEPQLEVALSYTPMAGVSGFLDLELAKLYLPETPEGSKSESTRLEVTELFVMLEDLQPGFSLQLGRSQFEDGRQWLYDEELDGVRAYYATDRVIFELSATRLNYFPRDLLNNSVDEQVNNYFALAHLPHSEESRTSFYLLARDERRADGEDLLFAGVQSLGEVGSSVEYWFDAALVTGEEDTNDIFGQGLDLGLSYTLDVVLEPAVTLGYAFGSGDDNPDGRDRNFRQTGLQGNEGEFTGDASFQYYGQVFDPELSNLSIFTLGLAVHPTEESSIDLVYHYYRQNKAVDELRDSNLEVDPDGVHRTLGQALDLILGYESEDERVELSLILGQFFPGAAFPNDASAGFFGGFEFKYQF